MKKRAAFVFLKKNLMGKTIGVSGMDISVDIIMNTLAQYKIGDNGYVMLVAEDGTFIYHPNVEIVGTNIYDMNISDNLKEAITNKTEGILKYKTDGQTKHGYLANVGETGYVVISCITDFEYNYSVLSLIVMFVCIFAIGLLAIILSMRKVAAKIVKPLSELNDAAMKLAEGDLDVELNVVSEDEVGELGRSIEKTVKRLKEYINYIDEISDVLVKMADGTYKHLDVTWDAGSSKTTYLALDDLAIKSKKHEWNIIDYPVCI